MRTWEISNPSDPYTCEGDDPKIVMAAVLCIGPRYGIDEVGIDTEHEKPEGYLFIFDQMEAYEKAFGIGFDVVLEDDDNLAAIADVLESVVLGHIEDRKVYKDGLELCGGDETKREKWRAAWQDRRSSMNDIGTAAHKMAKHLRAKLAEKSAEVKP